jgi:hypothetical protein
MGWADGRIFPPQRQALTLAAIDLMPKFLFILTLSLLTNAFLFGQKPALTDYLVYSAFIKTETSNKTKSLTIIKKLKTDTSSIPWTLDEIKSKDAQTLEQIRFLTRDEKGNSVRSIDTATQNLILGFYQNQATDSLLTNLFDISLKIFLVDGYTFKHGSQDEWRNFYKKYPGSGGLFQFSNIYYSQDGATAIFYHSVLRNGLNGHGALAIMTNINGEWKLKYHINFWQA